MKKILFLTTAAIVCSGLLFTSCKKKETEDNDTEGAGDHAMAETYSNDITNIGSQASYGQGTYNSGGTYREVPDQVYTTCATLTFDTLNHGDADSLTVDFGNGGCVGKDGRTRTGILKFVYTAGMHYRDSGNVIVVTTPGNTYHVDANQVIINSKTITNMGHVTNGMLTWNVTCNMQVNMANGNSVSWSTNKTKVLLAGEMANNQPINWAQAKVAIFGTASGTHTKQGNQQSFSVNVQQSKWLVRDFTCSSMRRFFVQGILEFTPGSKPTRFIDFGTGNCDNAATVTINGHVYNITLH